MSEFTVTHVAPPEGLQAWQAPDPSVPAVANVQAGVHMQLIERRGAWAKVLFSNGWSGWVDGRRMVEARPSRPASAPVAASGGAEPASAPAPSDPARPDPIDDPFSGLEPELKPEPVPEASGERAPARSAPLTDDEEDRRPRGGRRLPFDPASVRPIPALLGAGAVLLGSFFAWITIGDSDGNAYDVPLEFLWNHQTASGDGLKVGLVLLALTGAVGALCFLPGKVTVRRALGGVVLALTVLYVVQLQRALSAVGEGSGLFSALGFGVLLTLLGGGAIVYDRQETALR